MADPADKRTYPRITAGIRVVFSARPSDHLAREYEESVASNISLGGVFIETAHTFPPGSVISLRFYTPGAAGNKAPVRARAIVRWRRRLRKPRGMGVEFLELEDLGRRHLVQWLATLFPSAEGSPPRDS